MRRQLQRSFRAAGEIKRNRWFFNKQVSRSHQPWRYSVDPASLWGAINKSADRQPIAKPNCSTEINPMDDNAYVQPATSLWCQDTPVARRIVNVVAAQAATFKNRPIDAPKRHARRMDPIVMKLTIRE